MQTTVPVVCGDREVSKYNVWLSQEHYRATLGSGMPVSCLGSSLGQYAYIQKGPILGEPHILSSGFSTGTESPQDVRTC